MAKVEIYTTPTCPFCVRAKQHLDKKGVKYTEIDVMNQPKKRSELRERAPGRHTVPQIFINGKGIGGYDEMMMLEANSELDPLLSAEG